MVKKIIPTKIVSLVITLISFVQPAYSAGRAKKQTVPTEKTTKSGERQKRTQNQTPKQTEDALDIIDTVLSENPVRSSRYGLYAAEIKPVPGVEKKSPGFIQEHAQLINILRALLHIPYIVTLDSHDTKTIASCALLASLATDSRLLYELLHEQKNTSLLKNILWNLPKACGYAAGGLYEYGRFIKAAEVAEKNKVFSKQIRNLKILQSAQLALELILRGLAYKISLSTDPRLDGVNLSNQKTAKSIAEIADIVELFRLLSRYNTFFLDSEDPVPHAPVNSSQEAVVQQEPTPEAS